MPRVSVVGTGYLGLTHAVCLAGLGHEVLAIDVDEQRIARAANGEAPFFEPGLEPLLRKNLDAGRLRFTTSFAEVGAFGEVHFLCVGTPEGESGQADLGFVHGAADMLAPHLASAALIVGKSTVPVGTARQVLSRVRAVAPAGRLVDVAWNPEFLREGFAVQDSLTPDRIVLGVTSDRAEGLLREVYATPLAAGVPLLVMDLETAELVKVAANAFLATKGRRDRVVTLARQASGGTLDGKRVAVLGVAFKPNSDDVRDSASLAVCERLRAEGAIVSVHDPVAMPNAAKRQPDLAYAGSVSAAAERAELVLHLTEWADYRAIDPAALARVVARRVIIDARCGLDAGLWHDAGWTVHVLGRP